MNEVYVNSPFRLMLETGVNLSTITNPKIIYKKPDGTQGEWTASKVGTFLYYDISCTDLNISGDWEFQSSVLLSGKTCQTLGKNTKIYVNDRFEG